jgi:SPP1 family predicted phage head-tail adaptor
MRMMRTGALRHRVILESASKTPDGGGGSLVVWEEVESLWVAIRPLAGRELQTAGQFSSRLSHEIILRYGTPVLPEMRFRKGSRIFEIMSVMDVDEKNRWLRALCEEREL